MYYFMCLHVTISIVTCGFYAELEPSSSSPVLCFGLNGQDVGLEILSQEFLIRTYGLNCVIEEQFYNRQGDILDSRLENRARIL